MPRTVSTVRERILDAAIALLRESGVKRLAQPQVARAAGVPQGHLTYYFPRKIDLLSAVVRRFVEMLQRDIANAFASFEAEGPQQAALAVAAQLVKDRARTRMLLGLVVEAESEPALRAVLADCVQLVRCEVARVLGRAASDPYVDLALATLWGLGMQHMILAERRSDLEMDVLLGRMPLWFSVLAAAETTGAAALEPPGVTGLHEAAEVCDPSPADPEGSARRTA